MPYLAPEAPMPITSWAPRFAEMNASPHTQAGMERPARKKSVELFMYRLSAKPMPSTKAKYTSMMTQSTVVSSIRPLAPLWIAPQVLSRYGKREIGFVQVELLGRRKIGGCLMRAPIWRELYSWSLN